LGIGRRETQALSEKRHQSESDEERTTGKETTWQLQDRQLTRLSDYHYQVSKYSKSNSKGGELKKPTPLTVSIQANN
jgi:hypothetical protein